jgi:hypothetical protein
LKLTDIFAFAGNEMNSMMLKPAIFPAEWMPMLFPFIEL